MPSARSPPALIADDQRDVLEALRLLLKADGYLIDAVESPAAVVTALGQRDYDAVLIDLNYARDTTSGAEGLDLLRQIQQLDAALPVVVMTAWSSVNLAVEAMRRGARDFVEKPWNNERLQAIIRTQVELGRAIRRADRLEAHTRAGDGDATSGLIADAPAMQPVLQIIARVGPSDANVLITGENGTGKSLVARALHGVSPRAVAADGDDQRRRRLGRRVRERALRPRQGRLHRRPPGSGRTVRARRRQLALPRRDRQRAARPAAEAAAGARDRRVRAARVVADAARATCA